MRKREKLVIFGAGKYGQCVLDALLLEGIDTVMCFGDNSDKMIGKHIKGFDVLSLQDAVKRYANACYIISPIDYENEILHQLLSAGIKAEDIIIYNTRNTGMVIE